jgi:hypothetical protein
MSRARLRCATAEYDGEANLNVGHTVGEEDRFEARCRPISVGVEGLTPVAVKNTIFWDVTSCSLAAVSRCFGGRHCPCFECQEIHQAAGKSHVVGGVPQVQSGHTYADQERDRGSILIPRRSHSSQLGRRPEFQSPSIFVTRVPVSSPPLWSSGQSSWLQIQRSGFDSQCYQIFWEVVGLEWDPLSLVSTIEELGL